jgi:hypothetical protein
VCRLPPTKFQKATASNSIQSDRLEFGKQRDQKHQGMGPKDDFAGRHFVPICSTFVEQKLDIFLPEA